MNYYRKLTFWKKSPKYIPFLKCWIHHLQTIPSQYQCRVLFEYCLRKLISNKYPLFWSYAACLYITLHNFSKERKISLYMIWLRKLSHRDGKQEENSNLPARMEKKNAWIYLMMDFSFKLGPIKSIRYWENTHNVELVTHTWHLHSWFISQIKVLI